MKVDELKKLIRNVIKESIDEKEMDEVFGLSKKEKLLKKLDSKYELAKKEIEKYNFARLFYQPGKDWTNSQVRQAIGSRLQDFKEQLPNVTFFMPNDVKFQYDDNSTDAGHAMYQNVYGMVPAGLYFGLDNHVLENSFFKDQISKHLTSKYNNLKAKIETGGTVEIKEDSSLNKLNRYAVTIDFYMYAKDDNEIKIKAEELVKDMRDKEDNQASVISIYETPFGKTTSRKIQ